MGGRSTIIVLSLAIVGSIGLFFHPKTANACFLPASSYQLDKTYVCLGSWAQTTNVLDVSSNVQCFDTKKRLVYQKNKSSAFLNDFEKPAELVNDGCKKSFKNVKDVRLLLSYRIVNRTFQNYQENVGDIYGKR